MIEPNKQDMQSTERPFLEVHKNSHGAKIFKCCMSCGHKEINSFGVRHCAAHDKKVEKYGMCKRWMLSIGLERAGAGGGVVKVNWREHFLRHRREELERLGIIKKTYAKDKQEPSSHQ